MDILTSNFYAILATVVSGVLVYIIGEVLQTIWLSPLQKYKQIKHDVAVALSYHARVYINVVDIAHIDNTVKNEYCEVSDKLRSLSCEISGFIETLSWFKIGIPSKKKLREASDLLMLLSNSLFSPYNTQPTSDDRAENRATARQISIALGLYTRKRKRQSSKK